MSVWPKIWHQQGICYHPTQHKANILRKVYTDVETEPSLQPVNGEQVVGLTGDEARPDVRARGVCRKGQNAYFDIRVTNPSSNSQKNQTIEKVLKKHEAENKRQYNDRIMNIEHGTFTPLIFALNGRVGTECSIFCASVEVVRSKMATATTSPDFQYGCLELNFEKFQVDFY